MRLSLAPEMLQSLEAACWELASNKSSDPLAAWRVTLGLERCQQLDALKLLNKSLRQQHAGIVGMWQTSLPR